MIDMRNIQVLASGHYRVRVEHRGAVLSGTVATVEEAIELRDELKRKIVDGQLVPVKGSSAFDNGPRFLASRAGNRSVSDDEGRWHKHIATAEWARRALATVTRKDGVVWLAVLKKKHTDYDPKKHGQRTAKPVSWGLRRHCLNLARRFFAWAIEEELVSSNPFADLQVAREDGDEDEGWQEEWYLDENDQARLLSLWDTLEGLNETDRLEKWIAAFALGTGLREGELACLHVADVHVEGRSPHVVVRFGSWDAEKERYLSPKGRKGEKKKRVVDLWGLGLIAAKEWLQVRASYVRASEATIEKYRKAKHNPLDLMFPTERGHRRDKKPPRSWKKVAEAFGVLPRLGRLPWWHLLRHSCASSMVSGIWGMRWDLQDVQKILGHTDIRTTQIYAHLSPRAIEASAARADAAYPLAKVLPFRRHGADTGSDSVDGETGKTGHAREDSNLRPTAPEAVKNANNPDELTRCDGAVSAIRHVIRLVADGDLSVTAEQLEGLGTALDLALDAYAAAAARAEAGGQ